MPAEQQSSQKLRSAVGFVAIAAHNAEEGMFARSWTIANVDLLTQYLGPDFPAFWSSPWFRPSLVVLTLMVLALAIFVSRAPRRAVGGYILLSVLAFFSANALFPHIVGALALQAYVPGLVTAIALVLPATAWVAISMLRDRFATRRGVLVSAAGGMALYTALLGLVAIHYRQ